MERRISSLVSIGLLALLSGCGGGGGGGGSPTPTPPPPAPADTTPDGFTFTAQTGSDPASAVTSNEVTITGINAASAVTITGGTYSINGGAFTSGAGSVTTGQRVQVRLTASSQFLTASSASLTVGGVAATFTTTTRDADRVPNAFAFANKSDANRDAWISSDSVALAGFEVPLDISVQGGEYSLGGGAFTSAAGTATAGQTLVVRARSNAGWSRNTLVQVTLGSVSATFNLTTALPDYTPDGIAYDGDDIVYLLSGANRLLFRWSISGSHYLDPYELSSSGVAPNVMAYSKAHHRVYLGYSTGDIRFIDVDAAAVSESLLTTLTAGVTRLGDAGNYIIAQGYQYSYYGGLVLDSAGTITASNGGDYYGYSAVTEWDSNSGRLYYTLEGLSPSDLHYDEINQSTGQITSKANAPYHGSYNIQPPVRVSADGSLVLLGSGDMYNRTGLSWAGSLGATLTDARWFGDGSLAALSTWNNETLLRRLSNSNLGALEELKYPGSALRVIGGDTRMAVVLLTGNTVKIHTYVPSDDSDGDGVSNTNDAFPLDVAASADTDRDGFPDAWNTGRTQADSTTGLTLDAFAQDSACWLTAHGSGGTCNYGASVPDYLADQVVQLGDIVYLLSKPNKRVYRWSISAESYLNPLVVGLDQGLTTIAPTQIAVSPAHQRLYLNYATGAIRYIDLAAGDGGEVHFASTSTGVDTLVSAGNYLLAQGYANGNYNQYVYNEAGTVTDSGSWYYTSSEFAWDPNTSRVYWCYSWSTSVIYYQVVNQATGKITSTGSAPYDNSYYYKQPPLRVSQDGQQISLGSGEIYAQSTLTRSGATAGAHTDARWMANGVLLTLSTDSTQSMVRRLANSGLDTLEQFAFGGQALRVVGSDSKMAIVYFANQSTRFRAYVPNDDTDGDGVVNTQDAFPADRAASVDTDRDGYPDAWNAGRTQADSITGLALDAFAQDAACWLPAHGSGGLCNYAASMPNYRPDDVEQNGDIVYLLSSDNRRVYRWSISGGAYLNPYVTGINQGLTTLAPSAMTYSSSHQRLYLGYANGSIRYIDVNATSSAEVPFANLQGAVTSLGSAGNFIVAQGPPYNTDSGYIFNSSGVVTAKGGYYYGFSRETTWDPNTGRLYYMRDGTYPNDLHYDEIDQATGARTSTAETPYHSEYSVGGVIRPSPNGQSIVVGTGNIYSPTGLTWAGTLGAQVADARWLANGSLATLTTDGNQSLLRRLGSGSLVNIEQLSYTGEALRVVGSDSAMVVLVMNNGTVEFHDYVPSNDSDGDGVQNASDVFPLDPAASVDTDRDGRPDAWNAGQGQGNSTTGLTLDAYPSDSGCWLVSHGSGGICNPGLSVPNYVPDQVEVNGDVIHLLSSANRRVYRWSMATAAYLNPYVVGITSGLSNAAPLKMAYSVSHQRLYLGYGTGEIRSLNVNLANPVEAAFTTMPTPIVGLISAGNFLVADLGYYYSTSGTRVITSGGVVTDQGASLSTGGEYTWDPVYSRLYYAGSAYSTALYYQEIDQGTGEFGAWGNSQYQSSSSMAPPARVSPDGERIVVGNGDVFNRDGLTWDNSALGKSIKDAHWKDNLLVDVDHTDLVEIRNATTRQVLQTYQYPGQPIRLAFGTSEAYLVHQLNGTTAFVRLAFYDQDGDQIPRWWEQLYSNNGSGMNDANAGDATTDLDSDGINNRNEYLNNTNPLVTDTDGDGLSDSAEIDTWLTDPTLTDTDGDGLSDQAEVVTHNSDPLDTDSDDDGYTDLIEVLYGGDPNDVSDLPTPLTSYTQTFEGAPNLAAWYSPRQSGGAWARDTTGGHAGSASFKSGATLNSQTSATRFRGFFRPGQMTFWAKVDQGSCCNRMIVTIDGNQAQYIWGSSGWFQYTINVPVGVHEIEWRFERDYYGGSANDAAWIDDIAFAGQ